MSLFLKCMIVRWCSDSHASNKILPEHPPARCCFFPKGKPRLCLGYWVFVLVTLDNVPLLSQKDPAHLYHLSFPKGARHNSSLRGGMKCFAMKQPADFCMVQKILMAPAFVNNNSGKESTI